MSEDAAHDDSGPPQSDKHGKDCAEVPGTSFTVEFVSLLYFATIYYCSLRESSCFSCLSTSPVSAPCPQF